MSFVHLHVHSDYSPMEGVSSLKELCETARAHGADTLALTDTNGLYGAIRFLEIAKETGLRPILGAEVSTPGQTAPEARLCFSPGGAAGKKSQRAMQISVGCSRRGIAMTTSI